MNTKQAEYKTDIATLGRTVESLRTDMAKRDASLAKRDTWLIITGVSRVHGLAFSQGVRTEI